MTRINDGSPSDSTASGILVEMVDEASGDDDGTIRDEQLSEASSVGSIVLEMDDMSPGDMTNLTSPTKCQVYMTRMENGQWVYCCCGNDHFTCELRGHQLKEESHRAPGQWYESFPNPCGRCYHGVLDGRMDHLHAGLTTKKMDFWRATERAELA